MKIPFSGIIIIWCSVMSFACFMAMGIDKLKARAKKWRIPERTLFLLAAMGGALGGIFGMLAFRHKTKHKSFVIGMPLLLDYCERAYVTEVEACGNADCFFPDIRSMPNWRLAEQGEEREHGGLKYRFNVYKNHSIKEL